MSVWYCIPSIRPAAEAKACLDKWRFMGYRVAVLRQGEPIEADLLIPTGEYLGWARSTNILARQVLRRDVEADWIVGGGDDYLPHATVSAEQISSECAEHFGALAARQLGYDDETLGTGWARWASNYGVMQPTGDRWGDCQSSRNLYGEDRGAIIDRIAGSPWMGRSWCERSYLGNGPMWDGYHHLYADEELQEVAIKQGVFWQRPDLTQYHDHPARGPKGYGAYHEGHLAAINSETSWAVHRVTFEDRKAHGFPGSEPCPR